MQDAFMPTRRSLLSRLKNWDDQTSWEDFFNTYWKLIYGVARKAGLSDQEAQEVVQETVVTVAKKISQLKYDPALGSFKGWLLNTTRWKIGDQFRKRSPTAPARYRDPDGDRRTATIERVPDPAGIDLEAIWESEWEKNLVEAAMARVRKLASPKQYQIFDCHVIKNWPVQRVAKTLGVSAAQVYLAKHRVGAMVKKEIRLLQGELL
jgi:RNA polymerase sigma factor (sigma-70 family)